MDESEVKVRVSEDVAEKWAKDSPVEAAEWVSKMPEGEARSESMEEVVTQWARKDPDTALTWAQSIKDEQRRKKVEADVLNIKVMQAQREQAEAAKKQANESGPK